MYTVLLIINLVCIVVIAVVLAMTITKLNYVNKDVRIIGKKVSQTVAIDLMSLKEFEALDPDIRKGYTAYITNRLFPGIMKAMNKHKDELIPVLQNEPVANAFIDNLIAAFSEKTKETFTSNPSDIEDTATYSIQNFLRYLKN